MHLFHCPVCQTVNMNTHRLGKWKNYLHSGGCENKICWELAQAVWSVQHQWASTNGNSSETKQYLSPVYPTGLDWHYLASGPLNLSSLYLSLAFCNPFFSHSCCLVSKFTRYEYGNGQSLKSFSKFLLHPKSTEKYYMIIANSDVICIGYFQFLPRANAACWLRKYQWSSATGHHC